MSERLKKKPSQLAEFIQNRLGVENAILLSPLDIAIIGASVFAGDEWEIVLRDPDSYISSWRDFFRRSFQDPSLTEKKFRRLYLPLIGKGDFKRGTVASALRNAGRKISVEELEQLQRSLANELARAVYLGFISQEEIPRPAVTLSVLEGDTRLNFWGKRGYSCLLPLSVGTVVEYGPGIAASHRITSWLPYQFIAIEKGGPYKIQFLTQLAGHRGIFYPQIITRMDGIASATDELLKTAEGRIDLIIASNAHPAGEELLYGVERGFYLLRPGGYFVLVGPEQVNEGECSVVKAYEKAKGIFGNSVSEFRSKTIQQTTGRLRDSKAFVFKRRF